MTVTILWRHQSMGLKICQIENLPTAFHGKPTKFYGHKNVMLYGIVSRAGKLLKATHRTGLLPCPNGPFQGHVHWLCFTGAAIWKDCNVCVSPSLTSSVMWALKDSKQQVTVDKRPPWSKWGWDSDSPWLPFGLHWECHFSWSLSWESLLFLPCGLWEVITDIALLWMVLHWIGSCWSWAPNIHWTSCSSMSSL